MIVVRFFAKMERITAHPEPTPLGNPLTPNPGFSRMSSFGQGDITKLSTSEGLKKCFDTGAQPPLRPPYQQAQE